MMAIQSCIFRLQTLASWPYVIWELVKIRQLPQWWKNLTTVHEEHAKNSPPLQLSFAVDCNQNIVNDCHS